jgi:hypothetical protein
MGPALDVLEAELVAAGKATDVVHRMRANDVAPIGSGRPSSTRPPAMRRDMRGHRERRGAG